MSGARNWRKDHGFYAYDSDRAIPSYRDATVFRTGHRAQRIKWSSARMLAISHHADMDLALMGYPAAGINEFGEPASDLEFEFEFS